MKGSAGIWCRHGLKRLSGEHRCQRQRVSELGSGCRSVQGGARCTDAVLQGPPPGPYLPWAVVLAALLAELCRGGTQFRRQAVIVAGRGCDHDSSGLEGVGGAADIA